MNKHLKEFLHRGLLFGGLGPIVMAIIFFILSLTINETFSGQEILIGIISTYLLAFIQAGASVFNQIEDWPITKSMAFHLSFIYFAYLGCYLINSWIPFDWLVVIIFTLVFLVTYAIIWLIVYLIVKNTTKDLNNKIQ